MIIVDVFRIILLYDSSQNLAEKYIIILFSAFRSNVLSLSVETRPTQVRLLYLDPSDRAVQALNLNFSLNTAFDLGFTLPIQGTLQPFFGVTWYQGIVARERPIWSGGGEVQMR
jgi:hypothetical protein